MEDSYAASPTTPSGRGGPCSALRAETTEAVRCHLLTPSLNVGGCRAQFRTAPNPQGKSRAGHPVGSGNKRAHGALHG